MTKSALAGLRVIELSVDWSSSAICGRILSDLGADVVLVEPPSGHWLRASLGVASAAAFNMVAAGKSSFASQSYGRDDMLDSLFDLFVSGDVLLIDFELFEHLRRCGLDNGWLDTNAPQLIVCCVSPFGLCGPLSGSPGGEMVVEAAAGVLSSNGFAGDPPMRAGIPVAKCAGALMGVSAILAAVFERLSSGSGQVLDIAQYDSVVAFLGTLLPKYFLTGVAGERIGNRHTMTAPWNCYRTSDSWIVIATMSEHQWHQLAEAMNRIDLRDDERFATLQDRVRHVDALDAYIGAWVSKFTTQQATTILGRADVPAGPIFALDEVLADAHTRARGLTPGERQTGGQVSGPLLQLSDTPARIMGPAPDLASRANAWSGVSTWVPPGGRDRGTSITSPPLSGVRVLEVGALTAAPLAGRLLSMLGADVIKIEPPHGESARRLAMQVEGQGYLYLLNNTDKESITLDLASPSGRNACRDMLGNADVLITNLASDTVQTYGLDYEELSRDFSQLVHCSISGYGLTGPLAGVKAYDTIIQARAGIMSLTGAHDNPPLKVALSIADLLSACVGAAGVLAALVARSRTRAGQQVDASLHDVAVWATQELWPILLSGGEVPTRVGNRHPYHAPNGCYRTSDGYVAIEIQTDSGWDRLLSTMDRTNLIGDPRYSTAPARLRRVTEVDEIVESWTSDRAGADVVELCRTASVPACIPASIAAVADHPHTLARSMVLELDDSAYGRIRVIGSPFKFSRSGVGVYRAAPTLGAQNDALDRYCSR